MLCSACSKLLLIDNKRICLRCKGGIYNNLSVICDICSKQENICSICLKKMHNPIISRKPRSNCSSCGK